MSRLFPRAAGVAAGFAAAVGLMVASLEPAAAQPAAKQTPAKQPPTKQPPAKKADPKPAPKKADPKPATPPKTAADPKKAAEPKAGTPLAPEPPPTDGPPNPLALVRGLRDQGLSDLALEFLRELDQKPVAKAVKDEIPLERARCQLDAAGDEADESTRVSLVAEAKEGFHTFLKNAPQHPRAAEAYLALARLASLDAKAQLAKARRIDIPVPGEKATPQEQKAAQDAVEKQKAEGVKARKLFLDAADQFKKAGDRIQAQLKQAKLDPAVRRSLLRARFDADLDRGTNLFAIAETYLHPSAAELVERATRIDQARDVFANLAAEDGVPATVSGVARAWVAECLFEKKQDGDAKEEVKRIEALTGAEADEAKRVVQFFQLRRDALAALGTTDGTRTAKLDAAAAAIKRWLDRYGAVRRAQPEAVAARWYLGVVYQTRADMVAAQAPKAAGVPPAARPYYQQAEKLFRAVAQTDNEYTTRATTRRMGVVRRLLGEADRPPAAYQTFEDAQMAALIQMAKLGDEERAERPAAQDARDKHEAALKARRRAVVALLERTRDLATPRDNPADVADVLVRLIYFYEVTGQPYRAAVLGEHVARTVKAPGGKAAVAGALGMAAYTGTVGQIRFTDPERLDVARRADRDRAVRLARFLDEKHPNDTATDRARHQLAALLYEDGRPVEAYEAVLKVRSGYEQLAQARLFEGAVASQLLAAKDSPLAADRRRDVFRRAAADLDRLPKPDPGADGDDARAYLTVRCRLALLYLLQSRVDPDAEKATPGYARARALAQEVAAQVTAFDALAADVGTKAPNADGWEVKLLAEDARTRAVLLQGQALFSQAKYEEAYAAIGDVLAEMNRDGPYAEQVKKLAGGTPPAAPPAKAAPKAEPKKAAAPKPTDAAADAGPDASLQAKLAKAADGVDRYRRDLIVLALKIRIKQGQADQAAGQIELLKKFGGSIEANVRTLEQITADMASQILALRRGGKPDEAKALTDGFAKLLARLSAEPNLPGSVQRFLGQSLILVGEYDRAIDMLRKVPAPADRATLAKPADVKDPAAQKQVLEYRRATLELVRAYRLAAKYPEADALLKESVGTAEKPGWAYTSLDFRKESALLLEAKGAAEADARAANKFWGEALRDWSALYTLFRRQIEKGPPEGAGGVPDNAAFLRTKNNYFEAFFNVQRCLVRANQQLLKDPKFAPKLQKTFEDVGKRFADLEKASGPDITLEVRGMYYELLADVPELKKAYEAAGGKLFLEKPDAGGAGD